MLIESSTLFVIVAMAAVTYITKASGLWLRSHIDVSQRGETWLRTLPGAIVVSIIAPEIASGGVAELGAALIVLLVVVWMNNILFAVFIGTIAVYVFRHFPISFAFG